MTNAPTIKRALEFSVSESETLDLKRDSYNDSKDWLKDVTAFANTAGGRILIGVQEDEHGRAFDAPGFSPTGGLDQEIQKLNNWLRDLSEPDVSSSVRITAEENEDGKYFLVVDIQESSLAPHRLTIQSAKVGGQVYVRKGRDNVPASMAEIRDIMMGTNRSPRLIAEFVEARRATFPRSNPLGIQLKQYLAFHVCPQRGFGNRTLVDWLLSHPDVLIGERSWDWQTTRPNFLGAIASSTPSPGEDAAYHQIFYNGSAELVTTHVTGELGNKNDADHSVVVPGRWLKINVDTSLSKMLTIMSQATGCEQFEVSTTFGGVASLRLHWKEGTGMFAGKHSSESLTPWESPFYLPTVAIRIGTDGKPRKEDLSAVTDLMWRAWGEPSCPI